MEKEIKRYLVIAEGRVQGVGFRGYCMMMAQKYGLSGSVRNLDNGMVEIYIQGKEENIDSFLKEIRAGDRWIRVDSLSCKEVPAVPGETTFDYRW